MQKGILKRLFRMPPPSKRGEINHHLMDRFTLAHFAIGFGYACFGLSAGVMLFLALLWEVVENPLKVALPAVFPHATADTLKNMVGDTVAVILGWGLGHFVLK